MLDPYAEQVVDRARRPRHPGPLPGATHRGQSENRSCGDEIALELAVESGVIVAAAHRGRSCAVCAASADLLCERLPGMTLGEAAALSASAVTGELGIPLSPTRLKCALLPLDAARVAAQGAEEPVA